MGTDFADYTIGFVGTISVPNGGTGLTTVAAGSLVYGNGIAAMGVLGNGLLGQVLVSAGSGNPPNWLSSIALASLNVANVVTNVVPVAILGAAGQTVDLFDVSLSGVGKVAYIDKSGNFTALIVSATNPIAVTSGGTGVASCTAGQILTGTGTNTAAFQTPPGCRVYNSTRGLSCDTIRYSTTEGSRR